MKILFIGNSFSQDACAYMKKIAEAGNFDLTTVNLFIGGCSLERHCSNIGVFDAEHCYGLSINGENFEPEKVSLDDMLGREKYDIVSVQQASHYSGLWDTYVPYLETLVSHIRKYQPDAKIAVHETWAYEVDASHGAFARYEKNRHLMHANLNECYNRAAKLIGADIFVPVGDLIAKLRESWMFDPERFGSRLTRDGFHLSYDYGRYAAALLWCAVLGMENIEGNTFVPPYVDIRCDRIDAIKKAVTELVG